MLEIIPTASRLCVIPLLFFLFLRLLEGKSIRQAEKIKSEFAIAVDVTLLWVIVLAVFGFAFLRWRRIGK